MIKLLTVDDIKYICSSMMGVDWVPSFLGNRDVHRILSTCQSKLEVIYFLGILYYLHSNGYQDGNGSMGKSYPSCWSAIVDGHEGLWISEPFRGGRWGKGLSTLFVVPQYPSPDKPIHHDFGFFTSNNSDRCDLYFLAAIEIEGYAIHKQRREVDEARFADLSYQVIQVFEETSEPLYWYAIFDPDVETGISGECLYHNHEPATDDIIDPFKIPVELPQRFKPYIRGDRVYHPTFGEGVVLKSEMEGRDEFIDVQFQDEYHKKRLSVKYAKLARLGRTPVTLDYVPGHTFWPDDLPM